MALTSKIKNIFARNKEPTYYTYNHYATSYRPDNRTPAFTGERSIVTALYSRMAIDISSTPIHHVLTDKDTGNFKEIVKDDLDNILSLESNKDQTAKEFIFDICEKTFKYGYVAGVPYDFGESDDSIKTMRTGIITDWYPNSVKIDLYDDVNGIHRDIIMAKDEVCIFVNPLYSVMNEPNSILQRLLAKLTTLDSLDERNASGKLDIIIQLPYVTKTKIQQEQAEKRQAAIENQLANSRYGIAYIDSTEHITQLNRPAENNIMTQVEYYTKMLYNQLGITEAIFDGTADENQMINYYNRTIQPYLNMIVDEMKRKLLTKTARTQGHDIQYFIDPFRLASVNKMAEMADKFIRNEIMTKNEFRAKIGMKPSDDPAADELRNPNLNRSNEEIKTPQPTDDLDK